MASRRTIPQRELRNDVGRVLREAQSGTVFTVTVRGRPVASLGPTDRPDAPRVDVDRERVRQILAMPLDSADLARDLELAEAPIDDPWQPN